MSYIKGKKPVSRPQALMSDKLYQAADSQQVHRLNAFRENVEPKTLAVGRFSYKVWDCGKGEEAVVFLPGANGNGEIFFPFLLSLSSVCRVLSFSLPEETDANVCVGHIHALLATLGVKRVIIGGFSLGGLLAQCYARAFIEETDGMILCLTGAPSKSLPADVAMKWSMRSNSYFRFMLMPFNAQVRHQMGFSSFQSFVSEEYEEKLAFWRAYTMETYEKSVYKKQIACLNYKMVPKLYKKLPFAPNDLTEKTAVLILDSSKDQVYSPAERAELHKLYPWAQVHDMGGVGQFSLQMNESQAIFYMQKFVQQVWTDKK